jgi:hypothetical protein
VDWPAGFERKGPPATGVIAALVYREAFELLPDEVYAGVANA